jgi:hypothetical protein
MAIATNTSEPVARVLSRVHAKPSGNGWIARCPAHDDRTPSLSITQAHDGRALLHCHAGCAVDAICDSLGIGKRELFDAGDAPPRPSRRTHDGASDPSAEPMRSQRSFPRAADAVRDLEGRHGKASAIWRYDAPDGTPLGVIARWDTPQGKVIRPVSREASGTGWVQAGMPCPRPLYRLPALASSESSERIFVTEGEKSAEAVRAMGFVATTSPHGAKSAAKADWSPVKGHEVIILPDRDDPGMAYAEEVHRLCVKAGAKSVQIVRLWDRWKDLPSHGDIADVVAGHDRSPDTLRHELDALVQGSPRPDEGPTPYRPFPVEALPHELRSFVVAASKAIGCDACYVALPLLAGMAAAIGNSRRIELKPSWTEPAILWTAIVGESGTAKSPAMEAALRWVRKRQAAALVEHRRKVKEHKDAMAAHRRAIKRWHDADEDGVPPQEPEAPIAERTWTDDATTEAVAKLLEQNHRGILMIRDELSGWFNFDRYAGGSGGDVAKWIEMHGGRPMMVDRKGAGTVFIPRAAVSIAGGIQPGILRRVLRAEHRENGLAARLLLACPPRVNKTWSDATTDSATESAIAAMFERLYGLSMDAGEDGEPMPRTIPLSEDGKAEFVAFYNAHARTQVTLVAEEAAAWSKLEGYAARLALIIHLARQCLADAPNPGPVDHQSVAAAVALVRWFGDEAIRVYALLAQSESDLDRLIAWIGTRPNGVSVRDLVRGPKPWRDDAGRAETDLMRLVKVGQITQCPVPPGPSGGRPSERFVLNANPLDPRDSDTTSNILHASEVSSLSQPPGRFNAIAASQPSNPCDGDTTSEARGIHEVSSLSQPTGRSHEEKC